MEALNGLEAFTDSIDFAGADSAEFVDNNILDSLDDDVKEKFINSSESSVYRQQIDEEMNELFGDNLLTPEAMDVVNAEDRMSSSDVFAKYLNNRETIIANCPECGDDPFLLAEHFLEHYMPATGHPAPVEPILTPTPDPIKEDLLEQMHPAGSPWMQTRENDY